jgi:glycosyltransferase involved in cell wall biosynthesis
MCVQNLPVPQDPRVWREARDLARAGYGVSVVAPRAPGQPQREVLEDVEILRYRLPRPRPGLAGQVLETLGALWGTLLHVARLRRSGPIDVVHGANPPDIFFFIALLLRPFGARYVYDQHDPVPELLRTRPGRHLIQSRVMRALEWCSFRTASLVLTPNESCRQLALGRSSHDATRVVAIRNGPDAVAPVELRDTTAPAVVAFAGTINQHRGLRLLLDATAEVERRRPGAVRLLILGDGDAVTSLRQHARALGLTDMVEWGGWVAREVLAERLAGAAVCVAPDEDNEFMRIATSTKVTDYLALGLPTIVADLPENRVTAEDSAVYVEPGNMHDLAERIEDFLDDPGLRARCAAAARERAPALLWAHSSGRLVAAYRAMLENGAPSRDFDELRGLVGFSANNADTTTHSRLTG